MKGRDAMDPRDGMADPGATSTAGAVARQDDRARGAATTRPAAASGVDDAARRNRHGAIAYLKNLADELDARGLVARVIRTRSGVAFVRVVNPLATTMRENVTCAPSPAGLHDWYYWWSWGECMHCVDDPSGAASKVAHVLDTAAAPVG
jgi:hypothetical protein